MKDSLRSLAKIAGVVALASTFAIAATLPAQATQSWLMTGGGFVWLTSSSHPNGACLHFAAPQRDPEGSRFSTLTFPDSTCTAGAGTQCRSTVSSPDIGRGTFDVRTCTWR